MRLHVPPIHFLRPAPTWGCQGPAGRGWPWGLSGGLWGGPGQGVDAARLGFSGTSRVHQLCP
jgi:hypothetical protein